jgi:hypothetical protein
MLGISKAILSGVEQACLSALGDNAYPSLQESGTSTSMERYTYPVVGMAN